MRCNVGKFCDLVLVESELRSESCEGGGETRLCELIFEEFGSLSLWPGCRFWFFRFCLGVLSLETNLDMAHF